MFRSKCALKVLCVCVAAVCVFGITSHLFVHANAEEFYYTDVKTYKIDSSLSVQEKLNILQKAYPSGMFWNHHTEEELNGKQQYKIIVNGRAFWISEMACTGKSGELHANNKDSSVCQTNVYPSYKGRQCVGFARMIFYYLWNKEAVDCQINYKNDNNVLSKIQQGDLIYTGVHAFIVLNNPNDENGKVLMYDCNNASGKWCQINNTFTTTISKLNKKMKSHENGDKNGNNKSYVAICQPVSTHTPTDLTITTQPQNVIVDKVNDQATTSVVATGDGLTYQWYRKEPGKEWGKSSKTTATYSLKLEEKYDGILIYCVITDQYGNTATTDTVSLTVRKTDYNPTTEYKVVYTNGLRIRSAPGTSAGTVDVMKKDTHFWVDTANTQTSDGYTWAYSKLADGTTGWVAISNPDYCVPVTSGTDGRIPGDANGDGEVNPKDATRIIKWFCGYDVNIIQENCDVNKDGEINPKDATRIIKWFCGYDVPLE